MRAVCLWLPQHQPPATVVQHVVFACSSRLGEQLALMLAVEDIQQNLAAVLERHTHSTQVDFMNQRGQGLAGHGSHRRGPLSGKRWCTTQLAYNVRHVQTICIQCVSCGGHYVRVYVNP